MSMTNEARNTWIIGDVHGCLEELDELINGVDKINLDFWDRLIFVGDLIHKGPDSSGVVEFVRDLQRGHFVDAVVAGNHESSEIRKPTGILSEDQLEWLKTLPLFHRMEIERTRYFVVHAGIIPSFYTKHPEGVGQFRDLPEPWHKGGGKRTDRLRRFLRVRWVDAEGEMIPLGEEKPEHRFWADVYDGREGRVFFGHEAWLGEPRFFPHAVGVDTGCVFGGKLTAYCIETGVFVQVDARRKYAERRIEADE